MNPRLSILLLLVVSAGIYLGTAGKPPLLDDADASHALVAREMLQRGDWVVMYQNGVRYLEKAPLQYWMVAASYHFLGQGAFQTRMPLGLCMVGLTLMVYVFVRRFWNERAGLYAGLVACTSMGMYLFTRVMIPEALFALELTAFFYLFLRGWTGTLSPRVAYWGAAVVAALAVLTHGLVGIVFPLGVVFFFVIFTRSWGRWRELHLFSGSLIFLAIAVPWHVLAEVRSPGFLWSYFINEHFKRAVGTRYPPDYEAVPLLLWWALHLVWLFPWSIFLPLALREFPSFKKWGKNMDAEQQARLLTFTWAGVILVFFSLTSGSRMEYYSFAGWPALAILLGAGIARAEESRSRWLPRLQAGLAILGGALAACLGILIWLSIAIHTRDLSSLIKYHSLDTYRLSMAHILDLTPETFAVFRGPAVLAMCVFVLGFGTACVYRRHKRDLASTVSLALAMLIFFIAANWAFVRFGPRMTSRDLAEIIKTNLRPQDQIVQYGDITGGSSIAYYTFRHVWLYNGRFGTNLEYGSNYPDVPPTFVDDTQFPALWARPERVFLFIPQELRKQALSRLPADSSYLLAESGGKCVIVNQPVRHDLPLLSSVMAQLLKGQ